MTSIDDKWKVLFEQKSQFSGTVVVTEKTIEDEDGKLGLVRRLCFKMGINEDLIQSESYCRYSTSGKPIFDVKLRFQFHQAMVLGLLLAPVHVVNRLLIIGLGGGNLSSALRLLLGSAWTIDIVELDPVVVRAATEFFGVEGECVANFDDFFAPRKGAQDRVRILTGDGLAVVREIRARGVVYNALVLDVDAKNSDTPLEAPAECFMAASFLGDAAAIAECFILNLVCEDKPYLKKMADRLKSAFGRVYLTHLNRIRPCEELNYVVIAQPNPSGLPALTTRGVTALVDRLVSGESGSLLPDSAKELLDFGVLRQIGCACWTLLRPSLAESHSSPAAASSLSPRRAASKRGTSPQQPVSRKSLRVQSKGMS